MISRTFDMRQIARDEFLRAVHEGDVLAEEQFGAPAVREIVHTGPTTTEVRWSPPIQPTTTAILAFAGDVVKATTDINREQRRMSNITGASFLGEQFRSNLANVKEQLNAAGEEMQKAMTELTDTAQQAKDAVKAVKAETADLKSALGQFSNNPPT